MLDGQNTEAKGSSSAVKHAPSRPGAGEIANLLGIPPTNLSFHLKALLRSGLADMEKEGRFWRYRANIPLMLETIAYLTAECCSGHPGQCQRYRAASGISSHFLPPAAEDSETKPGKKL